MEEEAESGLAGQHGVADVAHLARAAGVEDVTCKLFFFFFFQGDKERGGEGEGEGHSFGGIFLVEA